MSVHLRRPGAVPALFAGETEAAGPVPGVVRRWRRAVSRSVTRLGRPAGTGPTRWLVGSLALLVVEAPLLKSATLLLTLALPR